MVDTFLQITFGLTIFTAAILLPLYYIFSQYYSVISDMDNVYVVSAAFLSGILQEGDG